jgi:hypothetical protein
MPINSYQCSRGAIGVASQQQSGAVQWPGPWVEDTVKEHKMKKECARKDSQQKTQEERTMRTKNVGGMIATLRK